MSQVAEERKAAGGVRETIYGPIQTELLEVEATLRAELRSRFPCIDELVRYGCNLGGKRLRPALVLLAGKATGRLTREHIVVAAVVEMIHTATLVHDDVLDEAQLRRHQPTVNARSDNKASVLLGDYLFTHSFYIASTLGSTYACETIGRSTNIVCEGELRQIHSRGRFDLTEEQYLQMIEAKTAELCACCCRLGAHYAAVEPAVEQRLERFGRNLGIAFQITDDLLDVLGDESLTGKSLGTDLQQRKLTLPLIRLLDQTPPEARDDLLAIFSRPDDEMREALSDWLKSTDAIAYSKRRAAHFASQAAEQLEGLPSNEALETLKTLPDFVLQRQH